MSHYHCGINIPGYMPEGDIETYRTQTEAISWLMDTKERLLDQDYDPDIPYSAQRRFHGNARKDLGYWYVRDQTSTTSGSAYGPTM